MNQDPTPYDQSEQEFRNSESLEVVDEYSHLTNTPKTPPPKHRHRFFNKRVFILITVALLTIVAVSFGTYSFLKKPAEKPPTTVVVNTQSLDNGTLNELTDQADGSVKQQLTISPDTLFKNSVAVQSSVTIDKDLIVRGKTVLQGTTNADELVVAKSLTVVGNTAIASNLNVSGQISASSLTVGSLTISSINLSSDLNFSGHLVPNGPNPTIKSGVAAGGGSVTVNGSDTSGTIIINTTGSVMAGELAIITFRTSFGTTPRVQLTPVNDGASSLNYFASKSASFFTVNTSSSPAPGKIYIFDYLVTQ